MPIIHAHALPGGVLGDDDFAALCDLVARALSCTKPLDALVLCLHGAMAAVSEPSADAVLAERIGLAAGVPMALSLDLHANCTPRLCAPAVVVTGYKTNPHVDLAATGARAVALLCATLRGAIQPVATTATVPAIFPDESLRVEDSVLGDVLDEVLAGADDSVVDVSVFPTQPWLDAPGAGFTAHVTTNGRPRSAADLAHAICDEVWRRREEFTIARLAPPEECLRRALALRRRPAIVTESADAPTAGGAGDSPAMLHALRAVAPSEDAIVFVTIVDAPLVNQCHRAGPGARVTGYVGASIDPRHHEPCHLDGLVLSVGDGRYALDGVGYRGLTATMGRFAVVRVGAVRVLATELPSWSADPATWHHAGLNPSDADVLIVRSCTDYLANFPESADSAFVADVDGPCTPRLSRLRFSIASPAPWPTVGTR